MTPHLVAIEGPCCAGKTTLARALMTDFADLAVAYVECYADHVGGGRFLPAAVPGSLAEDRAGLEALLTIEADRLIPARSGGFDLAILDRSVHTLLAHRYAIEQLTGLRCYEPALHALSLSPVPGWPDLVIFLDVPQRAVEHRNRGKFPAGSIFIDARFNAGIRAYYEGLTARPDQSVVRLDAELDGAKLRDLAGSRIRALLDGEG
jgi:thymidylate kinase